METWSGCSKHKLVREGCIDCWCPPGKPPDNELARLRQERDDLRVQYDQLCIECREFFNNETTAAQAQRRLYEIRDHIRRYEQRRTTDK